MNQERRTKIEKLVEQLQDIEGSIRELQEEEQEAFDNLPEGIQGSERGQAMEEAAGNLEQAADACAEASGQLEAAAGAGQ